MGASRITDFVLRPILWTGLVAIVLLGVGLWPHAVTGGDSSTETSNRIVAAAPSNVEIVCALGLEDRLVGVSSYATYPPSVRDLPKVGGLHDPDLEAILALQPDLLILRGKNPHVVALCRENDIRLYVDRTDTLPSLFTTITELGDILDRQAAAEELVASLKGRLDAVRAAAEDAPRPRVLLTLRSLDRLDSVTTVARGSYLHAIIELAGGDNIFGELDVAYPQVTLEEILARKPDVVLEAMPGDELDDAGRRELLDQWRAVGVFKDDPARRVHFLTEDHVLIPSPRVAKLAEKLQQIFANAPSLNENTSRDR